MNLSVCVTGMHVESVPVETVLQHVVGSLPPFMLPNQTHVLSVPVSLYIAPLFLSQLACAHTFTALTRTSSARVPWSISLRACPQDRTLPTYVQTETVCVLVSTQTYAQTCRGIGSGQLKSHMTGQNEWMTEFN